MTALAIPELRGLTLESLHVNRLFDDLTGPAPLVARARALAQKARAPSTVRGYVSGVRIFLTWCQAAAVSPLPITIPNLLLYLAYRSEHVKHGTVCKNLTAVRYLHTRCGFPMPSDPRLDDLLAGFAKESAPQRPKRPLRTHDVREACDLLDRVPNVVQAIRDRALFLLCHASVCRGSEILNRDLEEVHFGPRGLTLTIPRSKRNQSGPAEEIRLSYGDPATCPVRALREWVRLLPDDRGPLFRRVWSNGRIGNTRLHMNSWCGIVKRTASLLGYDAREYGTHSMRAGGLVSEFEAGNSTVELMRMGRFESERSLLPYLKYARPCPRLSVL